MVLQVLENQQYQCKLEIPYLISVNVSLLIVMEMGRIWIPQTEDIYIRMLWFNYPMKLQNEVGVNFLVFKEDSEDVYIKEFKRRVLDAIEILKKRNENAYFSNHH